MTWNTDIKAAPHGRYVVKQRREGVDQRVFVPERVILTTKCGKVVLSHYLPEEKRWLMLGKGEAPTAWQAWPEPYSPSGAAAHAVDSPAVTSAAPSGNNPNSLPQMPQAADIPGGETPPASGEPMIAGAA